MQTKYPRPPDETVHSIYLVDDDPDSAFLLKRDLLKAFPEAEIRSVPSSEVSRLLASSAPDLLVSAFKLQGVTGPELIAELRQSGRSFPIVMVSGIPVYREQALGAGADVFLTYDAAHRLGARLRPIIGKRTIARRQTSRSK